MDNMMDDTLNEFLIDFDMILNCKFGFKLILKVR